MTKICTTKAFLLPRGIANWHNVKERIDWCNDSFGEQTYSGIWRYDAVHHMMIIKDANAIMLYTLRFGE
jgi:hypothetical protein